MKCNLVKCTNFWRRVMYRSHYLWKSVIQSKINIWFSDAKTKYYPSYKNAPSNEPYSILLRYSNVTPITEAIYVYKVYMTNPLLIQQHLWKHWLQRFKHFDQIQIFKWKRLQYTTNYNVAHMWFFKLRFNNFCFGRMLYVINNMIPRYTI